MSTVRPIPSDEYARIIRSVPILCVDLALTDRSGNYVLVRRTNEPLKGEWWVVGGRVQLGEPLLAAARRKAREELGVDVAHLEPLGIYEDVFDRNAFEGGVSYHTVSIVFGGVVDDPTAIRLDAQHDAWRLADALPPRFVVRPFASPFGVAPADRNGFP